MSEKFEYLKEYMGGNYQEEAISVWDHNVFHPVSAEEINDAEQKMRILFPDQLKDFYTNIGEGYLTTPVNPPADYRFSGANDILPPLVAAAFYKPLEGDTWDPERDSVDVGYGLPYKDGGDDAHYMMADAYETLSPGDLPFFEIADSSSFMVLKPHSDNPNAVWYMGYKKIEDSFEKFVWNLYYTSPWYWEDKLS